MELCKVSNNLENKSILLYICSSLLKIYKNHGNGKNSSNNYRLCNHRRNVSKIYRGRNGVTDFN